MERLLEPSTNIKDYAVTGIQKPQAVDPEWRDKRAAMNPSKQDKEFAKSNFKERKKLVAAVVKKLKTELANKNIELKPGNFLANQDKAEVLSAIKELEQAEGKGFTAAELGITTKQRAQLRKDTFQIESELIADKIGFYPTAANLLKLKQHYGLNDIQTKKLRELILLDDWSTVVTTVLPYIAKYGPSIVDWAYQKFFGGKGPIFSGKDWGGSLIDFNDAGPDTMYRKAEVPGVTKQAEIHYIAPIAHHLKNNVNSDYIRTLLCPEGFKSLHVGAHYETVVYASEVTYTLTTNATSNSLFILDATGFLRSAGASNFYSFINPTTYVTSTGVYTGGTFSSGPVTGINGAIYGKIVGTSVQFVPTLSSNNNQGLITIWSVNEFRRQSMDIADLIKDSIGAGSSTLVMGNMAGGGVMRQAVFPNFQNDYCPNSNNNGEVSNFIIVQATGGPASTNIGKITVYYVLAINQTNDTLKYLDPQFNPPDYATQELAYLIRRMKSPFMQTEADIRKLLTPSLGKDFPNTSEAWLSLLTNTKPLTKMVKDYSSNIPSANLNKTSFDLPSDILGDLEIQS